MLIVWNVLRKKYDVQTYKEILAVSSGKLLDEIEKREERAKLPYQKPLIVTVFSSLLLPPFLQVVLFLHGCSI